MPDSTEHYDTLTITKGNLDIIYANSPNVFVAGDLLWYLVEGNNKIRQAPDVRRAPVLRLDMQSRGFLPAFS